jgi:hypothetical protein
MSGPHDLFVRYTFGSPEREEALKARPGPPLVRLAWPVLRYGRSGELARKLPEWVALFAQVQAGPEGTENLVVLLRYFLMAGDKAAHQAAGQVLTSVLGQQRAEVLMKSYGAELIEQGRQQGGIRMRAEDILRILVARGVPVDERTRQRTLTCTDLDTLNRWLDKSVNATTLSAVLDDLPR